MAESKTLRLYNLICVLYKLILDLFLQQLFTFTYETSCSSSSPGRIAYTQRFPLVILSRVWDLLISRLRTFITGGFPHPPPPLSVRGPIIALSSAPEGHVHQALAAGSQLRVRTPAGGRIGFRAEAKDMKEEGDGNLGISGSIRHLE